MKALLRTAVAAVSGVVTFLAVQLAIEFGGWWVTNDTTVFADPLLNAQRMGMAAGAGLLVALLVGLVSRRKLLR